MRAQILLIALSLSTLAACGAAEHGSCDWRHADIGPQANTCDEYQGSVAAFKESCKVVHGNWVDGPCAPTVVGGCKDPMRGDGTTITHWSYSGAAADIKAACKAPSTFVAAP